MLLRDASWFAVTLRVIGTAFLCWIAFKTFRDASKPLDDPGSLRLESPLRSGLVADLANPKAIVFWTSIFASTLPSDAPTVTRVMSVVLTSSIAFTWYFVIAFVASSENVTALYQRAKRWIDCVTALVLLALAVRLALT